MKTHEQSTDTHNVGISYEQNSDIFVEIPTVLTEVSETIKVKREGGTLSSQRSRIKGHGSRVTGQ